MKVDLSSVPESTAYAVIRLVQLAEEDHSGELEIALYDGGVTSFREPREFDTEGLKRLAAKENGT